MITLRLFVSSAIVLSLSSSLVLATHSIQTNGPVSVQIVEDVWDSPEFCFPCTFEDTTLLARTLRVETDTGSVTALSIEFSGTFHQEGDGYSLERSKDTHFLFDETIDSLNVTTIVDDMSNLTGEFSGFAPFEERDVAHLLFADAPFVRASYIANVTVDLGNGDIQVFSLRDDIIPGFVPEPSAGVIATLGALGLLSFLRDRRP